MRKVSIIPGSKKKLNDLCSSRLMNEIGIVQFEVKNLELNFPKLFTLICVGPEKKQQRFQLVVTQINALKTLRINSTS